MHLNKCITRYGKALILLLAALCAKPVLAQFQLNPPDIGFHTPPQTFIKSNGKEGLTWKYTTTNPGTGWFSSAFNDSSWKTGVGGFYRYDYPLAAWHIEDVDGTFVRIRNHWFPNMYLHTQHKGAPPFSDPSSHFYQRPWATTLNQTQIDTWHSAMWEKEELPDGRIRLRNRWSSADYLHAENDLNSGPILSGWESAKWTLEPTQFPIKPGESRPVYLKSYWGSYLVAKKRGSYDEMVAASHEQEAVAYLEPNLDYSIGSHFRLNFLEDVQSTSIEYGALDIWARSQFTLEPGQDQHLMFWTRWNRTLTIYINGIEAVDARLGQAGYRHLGLSPAARDSLKTDGTPNTIAVRVSVEEPDGTFADHPWANLYFDLGLALNPDLSDMPMDVEGFENSSELHNSITLPFKNFVQAQGISGAVLALSYNGELILSRSFGYSDKDFNTVLSKDAVLRLASVDKVVTKEIIKKMVSENIDVPDPENPGNMVKFGFNTKVFPLLKEYGLSPIPGFYPDPRADDITVQHLLDHKGWIKEIPDVASRGITGGIRNKFFSDLGIAPENHTIHDNPRWTYSQLLNNDPGSGAGVYSSNGYALLRYVAHQIAENELSSSLEAYMQNMFASFGDSNVFLAKESAVERSLNGEPWYFDPLEAFDRWATLDNYLSISASAPAMALFNDNYHAASNFAGSMLGSWTWLGYVYNPNLEGYIYFALMFNTGGHFDSHVMNSLRPALAGLPASSVEPEGFPCSSSNSMMISDPVTASQGSCLKYFHGGGLLRLGTWNATGTVLYDIKNCASDVISDVQHSSDWISVNTASNHCEHLIHVKQAGGVFQLQAGSW